jgi:TolA-binding protein
VLTRYPGLGLEADTLYRLGRCYQELNLETEAQQTFELIVREHANADVAAAAADQVPSAQ